ncbi:hypothetical protein VN1248_02450 [Helicobacter pylori]|nr:hypothetical protein VN1248_02450 [Helicobacter pylori]
MTKKPARKILSFSTTMRNPKRIGQFLAVLGKFENQILKSSTIMQIVKSVLAHRLYTYFSKSKYRIERKI